jgi:porin
MSQLLGGHLFMKSNTVQCGVVLMVMLFSLAQAQPATGPQSQPAQVSVSTEPVAEPVAATQGSEGPITLAPEKSAKPAIPRIVPYVDYSGDLWHRPALTGDWGGVRQKLMDKGIRFNLNLTQTYQGNVAGGTIQRGYYQGGLRYELGLDTTYMGLWPGGMLMMRGESRYGRSDNFHTGSIMPVNTDSLYPVAEEDSTCLTELFFMQFVAPQLGFVAGRMSLRLTTPFTGDETTQFMNTALFVPPIMTTTVPLTTTTAGVIAMPTKWLTVLTLVMDAEGKANLSGFDPDTVFEGGTSLFQMAQVAIKPFGLPGNQRVIWTWSDRVRTQFEQSSFVVIDAIRQGSTAGLARSSNDWSVTYSFDQFVYTLPGKPEQGIGLFGYCGFGPGVVNPIEACYSLGIGGKGMIPTRARDTYGIGYYCVTLSDKLPQAFKDHTQDEQGVEMYYNIEVTPWLHVTPDLQIIDPANSSVDTAWVMGVRARMDF